MYLAVGVVVRLQLDQTAQAVAHGQHSFDTLRFSSAVLIFGEIALVHPRVLTVIQIVIYKRVAVLRNVRIGGNALYLVLVFFLVNIVAAALRDYRAHISDRTIKECAEFMGVPKWQLDALDEDTQEQVIGTFDMQSKLVPDDKLKAELFELMNRKAGK